MHPSIRLENLGFPANSSAQEATPSGTSGRHVNYGKSLKTVTYRPLGRVGAQRCRNIGFTFAWKPNWKSRFLPQGCPRVSFSHRSSAGATSESIEIHCENALFRNSSRNESGAFRKNIGNCLSKWESHWKTMLPRNRNQANMFITVLKQGGS